MAQARRSVTGKLPATLRDGTAPTVNEIPSTCPVDDNSALWTSLDAQFHSIFGSPLMRRPLKLSFKGVTPWQVSRPDDEEDEDEAE